MFLLRMRAARFLKNNTCLAVKKRLKYIKNHIRLLLTKQMLNKTVIWQKNNNIYFF